MAELDVPTLKQIAQNAVALARRYRRRCWWVPMDDLEQEAYLAQLTALDDFDETRGPPLGAYLWYAGLWAVRRLVHKLSAPVSHSHRVEKLRGLTRASVMLETDEGEFDRPELTSYTTAEDIVHRYRVRERVRARTNALLGARGAAFALGVLSGEHHATDVCRDHGNAPSEVYAATQAVRDQLMGDSELYRLWRDT